MGLVAREIASQSCWGLSCEWWGRVCQTGGVVGRGELTDTAWERIEPLFPASGRGGQWRNHRQVINAILFELRTGAPWRDVPERYGPWKTAHERLRE